MKSLITLALLLGTISCSTFFQSDKRMPSSTNLEIFPASLVKSVPGEISDASIHFKGESGFFKKISMIEAAPAGSTISMAYFIFEDDLSSAYLAAKLIDAAKRGVKVQLLVDYFMSEKYIPWLKYLSLQSKNIKIKRFREATENFVTYLEKDLGMTDSKSFIQGLIFQNSDLLLKGMMSSKELSLLIASQSKLLDEIKKLKAQGKMTDEEMNSLKNLVLQSMMTNPGSMVTIASLPKFRKLLITFLRRMHHKITIAKNDKDETIFIVGGRNISDEYHISADELKVSENLLKDRSYPFFDSEVSGVFDDAQALEKTFEYLWTSTLAISLDKEDLKIQEQTDIKNKMDKNIKRYEQNLSRMNERAEKGVLHIDGSVNIAYVENGYLSDLKSKEIGSAWKYLIENAKKSIHIVSAYLYLYPELIEPLKVAASNGVNIKIYSNSATTTDLAIVNIGAYKKIPEWTKTIMGDSKKGLVEFFELGLGKGEGSLHAKIINVDDQYVGIGSANSDPRSFKYDTNNLVIMDFRNNSEIARKIFDFYVRNPNKELIWNPITEEGIKQILGFMAKDEKSKVILKVTELPDVINQL